MSSGEWHVCTPIRSTTSRHHLYRALEKLVEGEAAKVVSTVAEENGFEAWRQLHLRFEPELETQKNVVLVELQNIEQASSVKETATKMLDKALVSLPLGSKLWRYGHNFGGLPGAA